MVVYSGDDIDAATLLSRAKERFGLDLPDDLSLEVIYVRGRGYLEAARCVRLHHLIFGHSDCFAVLLTHYDRPLAPIKSDVTFSR